jgi:chromosome segregation ATPase
MNDTEDLTFLKNVIESNTVTIHRLKEDISMIKEENMELKMKLEQRSKNSKEKERELRKLKEESAGFKDIIDKNKETINHLNNELKYYQKEVLDFLSKYETQTKVSNEKSQKLSEELGKIKLGKFNDEEMIKNLNEQLTNCKIEFSHLKTELNLEKEKFKVTLNENERTNDDMRKHINGLIKDNKILSMKNQELISSHELLTEQVQHLNHVIYEHKTKENQINTEVFRLKKEIDELNQKNSANLETHNEFLKEKKELAFLMQQYLAENLENKKSLADLYSKLEQMKIDKENSMANVSLAIFKEYEKFFESLSEIEKMKLGSENLGINIIRKSFVEFLNSSTDEFVRGVREKVRIYCDKTIEALQSDVKKLLELVDVKKIQMEESKVFEEKEIEDSLKIVKTRLREREEEIDVWTRTREKLI